MALYKCFTYLFTYTAASKQTDSPGGRLDYGWSLIPTTVLICASEYPSSVTLEFTEFQGHFGWLSKVKSKDSPYSITERMVPELIPVLGSQPAGDMSHKPGGGLPLLSARPTVTIATLKSAAAIFTAGWTEARWVWTVCLRLLPDSVTTAIWTQALLRVSPAC